MTFKTFRQIVDNHDIQLLRERQFEISRYGWYNIAMEMVFTIDELREFADYIDWYTYVKRMDWNDMVRHFEFADKDSSLKNALEKYKRRKRKNEFKKQLWENAF